jgi:hypothetical protein
LTRRASTLLERPKENFYPKLSRKRVPYYRLSRVNSKW